MNKNQMSLIVLILLFIGSSAMASDSISEPLNTDINFVLTKGFWKDGEKYGWYRLVVKNQSWEHTRSFIYLQWIHLDQKAQKSVIISSVPIEEFNSKDWRNFNNATYDKNKFILNYSNRGRETSQKAILNPCEPGKYQIEIKDEPF